MNLDGLPLDRIQTMLKFAPGHDRTVDQLGRFMDAARREGLVGVEDGIWRLNMVTQPMGCHILLRNFVVQQWVSSVGRRSLFGMGFRGRELARNILSLIPVIWDS